DRLRQMVARFVTNIVHEAHVHLGHSVLVNKKPHPCDEELVTPLLNQFRGDACLQKHRDTIGGGLSALCDLCYTETTGALLSEHCQDPTLLKNPSGLKEKRSECQALGGVHC